MTNTRRKVDLYILSLGLLFIFFIIITIKFPDATFMIKDVEAWMSLIAQNPIPTISIILLIYCLYAYKRFDFDLKGATDIPISVRALIIPIEVTVLPEPPRKPAMAIPFRNPFEV